MSKKYVYIGELYDIRDREIGIKDKKVGETDNLEVREFHLSKTKSPIKYRHITAWNVEGITDHQVRKVLTKLGVTATSEGEWLIDDDDSLLGQLQLLMDFGGYDEVNEETEDKTEEKKYFKKERPIQPKLYGENGISRESKYVIPFLKVMKENRGLKTTQLKGFMKYPESDTQIINNLKSHHKLERAGLAEFKGRRWFITKLGIQYIEDHE